MSVTSDQRDSPLLSGYPEVDSLIFDLDAIVYWNMKMSDDENLIRYTYELSQDIPQTTGKLVFLMRSKRNIPTPF